MIATTEEKSGLFIDSERLWQDIHGTAVWGAIPGSMGMKREALSDADKSVRDWFVEAAREIGCNIKIDAIGNIFAILPGTNMNLPPIGMGSHLDTQPAGGRFDGILGVLSGLEVLRTISESGIRPYAPIATVCWSNEEGSRFVSGCTGSAVWSGVKTLQEAFDMPSRDSSTTFRRELHRINYVGSTQASYVENPLSAHFELHIEQSTRLEKLQKVAGVVRSIQGIRWYKVNVIGQQGHAGSTPMSGRADAHVATAKIVLLLQALATEHLAFGTVGVIESKGASSNTIPGSAEFTIDLRHHSNTVLDDIEMGLRAEMSKITATNPKFSFEMKKVWESPAATFDEVAVACVRAGSLQEVGISGSLEMESLAGHDSALTAIRVPTAMLFVPSQNGVSHAPEEYTSQDHCAYGAQVLLNAVMRYDAHLRKSVLQDGQDNSSVNDW